MRILFVIETMSEKYGGPVRFIFDLAKQLRLAGHRCDIFTTDREHPFGSLYEPSPGTVETEAGFVWHWPAEFQRGHVSIGLANALLSRVSDYDVVHINGLYRFPQMMAAWACRLKGGPYVISTHGALDPYLYGRPRNRRLKRIAEKLLIFPNLNRADAVLFTTQEEQVLSMGMWSRKKAVILPIGIDAESYRVSTLPPCADPYILFLGRIAEKKGLDILLNAFAKVVDRIPQHKLIVIGPTNDRYKDEVLDPLLKRLKLGAKVTFLGMMEKEDYLPYLQHAQLFALTSRSENFGITVLEALAAGAPVLISRPVNISRQLEVDDAAEITSIDEDEVAEKLLKLLTKPEVRAGLVARGSAFVDSWDWKRVASSYSDFYSSLSVGKIKPSS